MLEFKPHDLARAFGVHRNTVRNWIKSGKLPAQPTVGKRYRIRIQDLARFCARQGIPAHWTKRIIPQDGFSRFCELLQEITGEVSMQDTPVGAVLVAGGGVAGIQAALDLAESGYYVYMLERRPGIGGAMAQLDKTFPTNDCAM